MQGDAMQNESSDRIIRIKAVLERTGLSRSTMYRKMQNGTFPKNLQISTRCAGWRESAINAWLRNPMFYSAELGQ
jgi:prophage regulatory protein